MVMVNKEYYFLTDSRNCNTTTTTMKRSIAINGLQGLSAGYNGYGGWVAIRGALGLDMVAAWTMAGRCQVRMKFLQVL